MKKNLFYAAFALAMMASCTNEDNLVVDPVEPTPEDKVAIELGIDAPTVNATLNPRSTGSVGGTGETGDENKWNGQKLYITMVNKGTSTVTPISETDETPLLGYNTYKYFAPTGSAKDKISIVGQYVEQGQQGVDKEANIYYPTQGTYDFYGWHVDDIATALPNQSNPLLIEGIKITGQQDIMGARTKEFTEANYAGNANQNFTGDFTQMIGWDFSARTARNEIDPILAFEHQLARLKFFVRAGSPNTISDGTTYTDVAGKTTTNAMHVTAITVKKMADDLTMNLNKDGAIETSTSDPETEADDATDKKLVSFSLLSRGDDGNMKETLDPVAPTAVYDGSDATKGVQVGESVMFFPYGDSKNTIDLSIALSQYVKLWEDTQEPNNAKYWGYKTQNANLKVHATSVVVDDNGTRATEFEAGKSYNVYITVYGFEKIEVTAELTAWEMGGDVDVDVEEGESKHTVEVGFTVQDEAGVSIPAATVTVMKHTDAAHTGETALTANENGDYEVESFSTLHYTATAQGYVTTSGVINAENGKDVVITMKAEETQTPTTETVSIVPATGSETGTVSVKDSEGNDVSAETNGSFILTVGNSYTYTVTLDGYTTITETITATAGTTSYEYTLVAIPTTYNVTFTVKSSDTPIIDAAITVTSPENITVTNNNDGTYTATVPAETTSITYSVVKDGYTMEGEGTATISKDNASVAVNMTVNP